MRRAFLFAASTLLLALAAACGGGAEIGEACETPGATSDECVDGAVCGDPGDGTTACLKICTDKADCAANEDCNGTSGSNLKGCRPIK